MAVNAVVVVDEQAPPHHLHISVNLDGSELTITVSPRVKAPVLLPLASEFADLIISAIEGEES